MAKRHNKKSKNKKNPSILVSYRDFLLPPVILESEVIDLCKIIDNFYRDYPKQHKRQKPSDLIKGAFYAVRPECRTNPDWMSQAANSARDVLYPLFAEGVSNNNLIKLFKRYAINQNNKSKISNKEFIKTFNNLDEIYKQLSDLTHHGTDLKGFSEKQFSDFSESDFENLLKDFTFVLRGAFNLQQIYIHTIIDLIAQEKEKTNATKNDLCLILNINLDARQIFFAKADEHWLDWLWENGFLGVIKQKAEDLTRYEYRMPEINYLVRVAKKEPRKVVDIMLAVPISTGNFNPEVVNGFLQICSGLPAPELKRMVKKIRDDGLVQLMGVFNDWGFGYEEMLKTLTDANDFDSVLVLVEAVLSIRTKKEAEQTSRGFLFDNPFYFKELIYTKVFEYLLRVDEKNIENALALVTSTMKEVVLFGVKEGRDEVFKVYDSYLLLDVDFFELELTEKDRLSHRDDVKNLAAVIKHYAEQIIGKKCDDVESVVKLYNQYFNPLPDSRSMWRLRLFVLSLCPGAFKEDLKRAFFRLFEVDRYYNEIIFSREYLKALRIGFPILSDDDKRKYVKQVMGYFVKKDQEKENEKENWHIEYGSKILSVIADQLTEEEKQVAEKAKFTIRPDYEPEPYMKMDGFADYIRPRGPITQEAFGKLLIDDIAKKLRTEWKPEKLREKTSEDFPNPLNADGVSELLSVDISKRLQDYVNNANLFFERDILDQHYTYSFLRGVEKVLRGNKTEVSDINWNNLITLCVTIKKSGETKPFDSGNREYYTFDVWLSSWTVAHSAMTDVVQELLTEERGVKIDFPKYRDDLFGVIGYLLSYPDPVPADEEPKTAKMTTTLPGVKEQMVSDPYSMAINTVRGRAFQAFALFMYQDEKKFSKDEKIKIATDVKGLYESVLKKENTRALMFMFGHYLPSFYFRDKEWIQKLLSQIFSVEPTKKNLYTAAWEGYVSTNLYEEIFFNPDIQKLYERGLALIDSDYPQQMHFKEPDEGVAVHVVLAFIHFSKFDFDHDLFKKFWGVPNPEHHKQFISFIGRHSISRESAAEWIKYNKVDIEKLKKFWDWALENCNPDVLTGFGFWINTERSALDTKWLVQHARQTLDRTKGYVEWGNGLKRSLATFAKEAPEDTLAILRDHLLEEVAKHEPVRTWLDMDTEVYDTFKELYKNEATKEGVCKLINDLLSHRNGMFWGLKSILDEIK